MGPREGSPAPETLRARAVLFHRAARCGRTTALFILALLGWTALGWAATAEVHHEITVVVVHPQLSMDNPSESVPLTFSDRDVGSGSQAQRTEYRIATNAVSSLPYDGVVSAQVEKGSSSDILLEADVGSFTNLGAQGGSFLYEHAEGFQAIGSEPTSLARKSQGSDAQSDILNGELPVRWRAKAVHPLRESSYTVFVTVTLKDV